MRAILRPSLPRSSTRQGVSRVSRVPALMSKTAFSRLATIKDQVSAADSPNAPIGEEIIARAFPRPGNGTATAHHFDESICAPIRGAGIMQKSDAAEMTSGLPDRPDLKCTTHLSNAAAGRAVGEKH